MTAFTLAFAILIQALAAPLQAQTIAGTRRDSVYRAMLNFAALVQGGRVTPQWLADKPAFWYVEERSDSAVALRVNAATGSVRPLLDVARARAALRKATGKEPPARGLPFRSFTLAPDEGSVSFEMDSTKWRLDLPDYQAQVLGPATPPAPPRPTESPSPNGKWLARAEGNNLWVRAASGDTGSTQLTTDGIDRFGWKGPPNGTFDWSPDGNRFLATRSDERQVHHIPVVHWLNAEQEKVDWVAYPHSGSTVPASALYVVDVTTRQLTRIDAGEQSEGQLRPAGWRKDGQEVYLLRTDRLLKRVDLLAADPRTGATRLVLTETQPTFVEGLALNPVNLFTPFIDGSKFIWRSERDGWSHLYLYQRDGTLLRRLTSGAFPVEGVVAVDEKGGWVYYLARDDRARPYDLHLHRVSFEGGSATRLTAGQGEHSVTMSPDFQFFTDTWSSVSRPPVVELRKSDGTLVRELAKADISGLAGRWKEPEEFRAKAADGTTDLYGVLYRPFDFDASRKYPVIDLQYMGNFTTSTPHRFYQTWLGDEAQALTQLGFIVLIVDGRGTTGRGKAFQDFTYNNIGTIEVPDHATALRQVAATRPWMDTTRVGITGYSWGGYYTLRAMLTAPELYKVGVAGAPVVDMLAHVSPIEPYMGRPQENAEAYARASNLPLASRLEGKLLMTIGTTDVNVTFNHTMRMADAFIKAGKHFDLLVLPEETHGLTPAALAYYKEARAMYFVEHLRP